MHIIKTQYIHLTDERSYPLELTCTCQLLSMREYAEDNIIELVWRTDPSAQVDLTSKLHLLALDEKFPEDLIYIGCLEKLELFALVETPAFEAPLISTTKKATILQFTNN